MKAVVTADFHFHPHKGRQDRLDDCLDCFRWTCDTAIARGIQDVIVLGDLFHDRVKIHMRAYHKAFDLLRNYTAKSLRFHLLIGNHDLWQQDDWDVCSVAPLDAIDGVRVIARPLSEEFLGRKVDWLPFTRDPLKFTEAMHRRDGRLLLAHVSVCEAQRSLMHASFDDLPIENESDMALVESERFIGWEKVISGHIHLPQVIGNLEYIGSPLELRSDEMGQDKHIGILDFDDFSVEHIKNDFSPRHLKLRLCEIEGRDLNNCFVKIVVDDLDTIDMWDVERKLQAAYLIRKLEFCEDPKDDQYLADGEDESAVAKFNLADGDAIRRYIHAVGTGGLDEDKLAEVGLSLCEEA